MYNVTIQCAVKKYIFVNNVSTYIHIQRVFQETSRIRKENETLVTLHMISYLTDLIANE